MKKAPSYQNKRLFMEQMAAFSLYLEEGIEAVRRMYPQHVLFVQSNQDKTQTEVKKALLHSHAA